MNLQLGVAGAIVPSDPAGMTPQWARAMAAEGITALVTHLQPPAEALVGDPSRRVRDVLGDAGIRVAQAAAFDPHLIHPDDAFRRSELERLPTCFEVARDLGAEMLITGCGSLHPDHRYGPDPRNHDPATRERLVDSLRRVAPLAEHHGVILALECHVMTTLDTPAAIRDIIEAVDSPWVRPNFDPVNMIGGLPDLYDTAGAMERMWEALGSHYTQSAHVKDIIARPDFVLHLDEVAPGQGWLDLAAFFAICQRLGEGAALIVEHLPVDQVDAALQVVREAASEAGVTL